MGNETKNMEGVSAMTPSEVVVAMPSLNEANNVVKAIASLLRNDAAHKCRFLLLDGGSTDGTISIVRSTFGKTIEIVDNPLRLQGHAINLAAQIASERGARYLLRADLHAVYPPDFISTLLRTMNETGAASVAACMATLGGNAVQDAGVVLYSSWLGTGGSAHREGKYRGWVDDGHNALFRLDSFVEIGGYDPEFAACEDVDIDWRLRKSGHGIFLENMVAVGYYPRDSFRGTFRQFSRNGRFRIWLATKHRESLSKRQIVPILVVPVLTTSIVISPFILATVLIPMTYAVLLLVLASKADHKHYGWISIRRSCTVALLAAYSHIGFSAGAMRGLWEIYAEPSGARRRLLHSRRHSPIGDNHYDT